ncbi:MAG: hypothetical protein J0H99_14475, partial [Rhodospirillales bacterium]|nr:hypothetical protein [Rhodospirillales bacterium]
MQSSNHTEGPWDINAFNLTQIIKVKSGPDKDGRHYKDGRHQIVIANVGQDGDDWAERRANVHLMRAAPDMQAAL